MYTFDLSQNVLPLRQNVQERLKGWDIVESLTMKKGKVTEAVRYSGVTCHLTYDYGNLILIYKQEG
jgi:hypothetical protein